MASGATVILGLLCLLLSDLNSNKSLGPVGAIGIACAVVSMLVFLPALLMLAGRYWFWPFVPRHDDVVDHEQGIWGRVARLVGRRPRMVWVGTSLVLVGAALFTTQLNADGLTTAEQFTTEVDSVVGQEVLARHYPAGSGVPVSVIGDEADADQLLEIVRGVDGIADAQLRPDAPPSAEEAAAPTESTGPPKVIDGKVQVEAVLSMASDTPGGRADGPGGCGPRSTRSAPTCWSVAAPPSYYDIKQESARDNRVIIPAILVVIFLVLALLLRAIVAPLLLVATVVLSFFATMGVCALVFDHVFGFAGADPSFPLFAFVFLVALGIDYNIFLMTRVREEAQGLRHPARDAEGARRHRRRHHLGRHRARGHLLRARRPAAGAVRRAGLRGRVRRAARHAGRALAARAGARVRARRPGLVADRATPAEGRRLTPGGCGC